VGGRMHSLEEMTHFVEVFLATDFSGAPRHQRRIDMLGDYEKTSNLPPLPASATGSVAGSQGGPQGGPAGPGPADA